MKNYFSSKTIKPFKIIFSVLIFFSILINLYAIPSFLETDGRIIPLSLNKSDLSQSKGEYRDKAGNKYAINSDKNQTSIYFFLNSDNVSKDYAVQIKSISSKSYTAKDFSLIVNDKLIDTRPVISGNELFFMIKSNLLKTGENEIVIEKISGQSSAIDSLEMFSLFRYEVFHFGKIFSSHRYAKAVQPPADPDQNKYDAQHYDLSINVNMTSDTLSGILIMTAKSLNNSLITIPLDFNDNNGKMIITGVDNGENEALPFIFDGNQERLFINLPRTVSSGNIFKVRVYYTGIPSKEWDFEPPYYVSNYFGNPMVATLSEPYGARMWWPCKDIPEDKATADIRITCPDGYQDISNGKLESVVDNGNGTTTYNWHESYPIATYLVSLACANYQAAHAFYTSQDSDTTMTVSYYNLNMTDSQSFVNNTVSYINFLAEKFGEYPFLTEKYCNVAFDFSGGMEHQTCTSFGIGSGLDGDLDVHELAHQWFGDKITMHHFNDLWLNEGFATYCEALYHEHLGGIDAYLDYVNRWFPGNSYPLVSDHSDAFYSSIVYDKGAWVLHMLRKIMGDAKFFQALKNYIENPAYAYGNVVSADFQYEVEKVYGKSLAWFFNEWLYLKGRPNYQWAYQQQGDKLSVFIHQYMAGPDYIMPIDFRVSVEGQPPKIYTLFNNQKAQYFTIDLEDAQTVVTNVEFDPENWLLDNHTRLDEYPPNFPTPTPVAVQPEQIRNYLLNTGSVPPDDIPAMDINADTKIDLSDFVNLKNKINAPYDKSKN